MEKEKSRDIHSLRCLVDKKKQRALKVERQLDAAHDKITQQRHQSYDLATQLEEEKGKILKLKVQMNRNYENSSIPSSKSIKNKKILNSREKTDRKQGA